MKKVVLTQNAPAPIGPYSQAIEAGGLLFISGQIPVDVATGTIPDGLEAQANLVLKNLGEILEAADLTYDSVVKTTVFLSDLHDFAAVNQIYATYFGDCAPARSCVEVARLPKEVLLEIEAIAVIG